MIYFSELKNSTVHTEDGVYVGKIKDLIFLATDKPTVTKVVLKTSMNNHLVVPVEYITKWESTPIVNKKYQSSSLEENELYVEKNLLDKQIIDIKGNKVVRVNDIAIQNKPVLYVAGVDIGVLGILRWLSLEEPIRKGLRVLGLRISPNFLSWADIQPLELSRGKVILKTEQDKLEKIRAEDLADYLEKINVKNITKILNILDEEFAAEVIGNLNINYQNALFNQFTDKKAAKVISLIDPDESVDILLTFSHKKQEQIIANLEPAKKKELLYLLSLSKTPIGEIITSEFITVHPQDTVKHILEIIRKTTGDFSMFLYVYVVNNQNQLIGVINLHELIMKTPETQAYKFMVQDVVVIHLTTPEEIAIKKMLKYQLQALPVIDKEKHILGIVTLDDISEFILERL